MPEQDWNIEEPMAQKSSVIHHTLQALSPAYPSQAEDYIVFLSKASKQRSQAVQPMDLNYQISCVSWFFSSSCT